MLQQRRGLLLGKHSLSEGLLQMVKLLLLVWLQVMSERNVGEDDGSGGHNGDTAGERRQSTRRAGQRYRRHSGG